MKILKRYTKKRRLRQRRQLQWRRDVHMTVCMLDWKQKKMKRSCTDWLGTETEQGKMYLHVRVIKDENGNVIVSVVEWLKHRTDDQHGLGSKPTCAILLCSWERHFTALFPAWWSWQAVLNYSNISTKLLADRNSLASPEAGRDNCLPYV